MATRIVFILSFLQLGIFSFAQVTTDTKDIQVARQKLQIGTDTSRYFKTILQAITSACTHRQCPTSKAVYDWVTTLNHSGDVSGPYNNLQLGFGVVGVNELADGAVTGLKMNQNFASTGYVWKWNGTSWQPAPDAGITGNQTITLSGDGSGSGATAITVTNTGLQGRSVSSTAPTTNQVLKWNGSAWAPAADAGGAVNVSARLTGYGTAGSPLDIAQQSASTGQVLKWDGTSWTPGTDNGISGINSGQIVYGTSPTSVTSSNTLTYSGGTFMTLGTSSTGKEFKVYNNSSSTGYAGTGAEENIWLQNGNATTNNWSGISSYSAGGGIDAALAFQHVNHGSLYGDITFYNRGTAGFNENLRISGDRSVKIGGLSGAAGSILNVDGNGKIGKQLGTNTRIPFWSTTGLTESNSLFWDDPAAYLHIGNYTYNSGVSINGNFDQALGTFTALPYVFSMHSVTGNANSTGINNAQFVGIEAEPSIFNSGTETGGALYGLRSSPYVTGSTSLNAFAALNLGGFNQSPNVQQYYGVYGRIDEQCSTADLSGRAAMRFQMMKSDAAGNITSHTGAGLSVECNDITASGRWKSAVGIIASEQDGKDGSGIQANCTNNRGTGNNQTGVQIYMASNNSGTVVDNGFGIVLYGRETSGGLYQNYYGIYQAEKPASVSGNDYFLYSDQTSKNYLKGKFSIGTTSSNCMLTVGGTDAIQFPTGTSAQRPASPYAGMYRYNTDLSKMEYWNGSSWVSDLAGTAYVQGGNSFGTDGNLGTNDNYDLRFRTNNTYRAKIDQAGSLLVGGTSTADADASSIVQFTSTTKGFLPPIMTNTQIAAISSPTEGLEMYSSTDHAPKWKTDNTAEFVTTASREKDITGTNALISATTYTVGGQVYVVRFDANGNNITATLGSGMLEGYDYVLRCTRNGTNTITFNAESSYTFGIDGDSALTPTSLTAGAYKIYYCRRHGSVIYIK